MIESAMDRLIGWVKDLLRRVERLEAVESSSARWVILPQASRLSSTAWDGDARSTTAATKIDMSAVFGTPANIDAVLLQVRVNDSGAASANCYIQFDNANPVTGSVLAYAPPVNSRNGAYTLVVPTDASGDIYYLCVATGTNTLVVDIRVNGYHLR